jgi:rfaE bifunctional protein kinase chain/domain
MYVPHLPHPLFPPTDDHELLSRFLTLIDRFKDRRIVTIGDLIADEFVYGQLSRVSREAPVLILKYDATEVVPGGAGNAANNAADLGGNVTLVGVAGREAIDRRLLAAFRRGVDTSRVVRPAGYRTTVKTRILAGGMHSARQQVVRIDREAPLPIDAATRRKIEQRVREAIVRCDGVLLSDYGSGLVTPALAALVTRALARSVRRRTTPVLIDSRYALLRYRGLTACTPNESEVEQLLGVTIDDNPRALERAGREVLRRTRTKATLITRGSRGMALFEPGVPTTHVPIHGSDQVADVTGAGDTVIATMTMALAAGASFYEAARLANYAGGLVVMKRGTATVSADELRRAIEADLSPRG